jgi:hypothetical protein
MGNFLSSEIVSLDGNDKPLHGFYTRNMASRPRHDWYFRDWLLTLRLKQSDIVARTDWPKSKVSKLVNGSVAYNREIINEAADAMNLRPFELLLHPEEAMAMRGFRQSAITIASQQRRSSEDDGNDEYFELGKRHTAR